MEYNIKMVYEQDDFIGLMKAMLYNMKSMRILRSISKVIFGIIGGFLIFIGAIGIFHFIRGLVFGEYDDLILMIILDIVMISIGLLILSRSDSIHLNSKRLGKKIWKKYKEKDYEITYSFYSDRFIMYRLNSEHRLNYSIIKGLCEDAKRYYLFVTSNDAHIIKKEGFKLEDSKNFGIFIAEKTGLSMVQIK